MAVDCYSCRKRSRCRALPLFQRRYCFDVYAKGRPEPSCPDYAPDYYHGIDGVLASPHPSLHSAQQSIQ